MTPSYAAPTHGRIPTADNCSERLRNLQSMLHSALGDDCAALIVPMEKENSYV